MSMSIAQSKRQTHVGNTARAQSSKSRSFSKRSRNSERAFVKEGDAMQLVFLLRVMLAGVERRTGALTE